MTSSGQEKKKDVLALWNVGPGPAVVKLPPTIGYIDHDKTKKMASAYTFGYKTILHKDPGWLGPGPGHLVPYGFTSKGNMIGPSFSIKSRTKIAEKGCVTPGPGAYSPKPSVYQRRYPAAFLARRAFVKEYESSPGPKYLVPSSFGPKVPDKTSSRSTQIKGRLTSNAKHALGGYSPGPIYDVGSPYVTRRRNGVPTLKGRWKTGNFRDPSCGNSPASYEKERSYRKILRSPPSYSFGERHSLFAGNYLTECDRGESSVTTISDCNADELLLT